ncbi:MAG: hypothetical protein IKQ89_01510 [Muribaculaceae bacterium]|nr:hypothetical protein [Muribaculaceae bacterium]
MDDKKLNERESLELITEMIERTKQRYVGDGNIMLVWGYTSVAVAVLIWVLLAVTGNPAWNWLWFLIWIIGLGGSKLISRNEREKFGVKSYSDKMTSNLWSVVGWTAIVSSLLCFAFMFFLGVNSWLTMMVFALVIVPFAEIAQGIVVNEKTLIAGGAVGLLAGLITICCITGGVGLKASWFMPMFIVVFIAMMIIPGHILNRKNSAQQ